jgi:hypothetical protein
MTHYLSEHPEISVCTWKEVHYFAPELFPQRSLSEEDYLALFPQGPGVKRFGEASVWYLYSEQAAERIKAFAPQAQIVVMLREPAEMLCSLHAEWSYSTKEWVDFETALTLDADREAGRVERRFVPRTYRSAAMYAEQVERYLRAFGRERVHVILYDDFAADPAGEYRRLCGWLDVDDGFAADFRVINGSKRMRSRALGSVLRRPPEPVRRLARAVTPRSARTRLWNVAVNANRVEAPKEPMPERVRDRLREEFADDVDRLAGLIGRDLGRWKQGIGVSASTPR